MIRLGVASIGELHRQGHTAAGGPAALLHLRDTIEHLERLQIGCYRVPASVVQAAPEHQTLLAMIGARARTRGTRLTMHAGMGVALGAVDTPVVEHSVAALTQLADVLEQLDAGADGTIVVHLGGAHTDAGSCERFARQYGALAPRVQKRLAVEPDDAGWSAADVLALHARCGVPVVLDILHWQCNNPERLGLAEALRRALATWPADVRPKVHLSTQRTEAHVQPGRGGHPYRIVAPRRGEHADFLNPFEAATLLAAARGCRPFDLMIEARAGDLALVRLRDDLQRYAPELAVVVR